LPYTTFLGYTRHHLGFTHAHTVLHFLWAQQQRVLSRRKFFEETSLSFRILCNFFSCGEKDAFMTSIWCASGKNGGVYSGYYDGGGVMTWYGVNRERYLNFNIDACIFMPVKYIRGRKKPCIKNNLQSFGVSWYHPSIIIQVCMHYIILYRAEPTEWKQDQIPLIFKTFCYATLSSTSSLPPTASPLHYTQMAPS